MISGTREVKIMPVKVLIKRQFKKNHIKEIKYLLKEARYDAMDQEGYISSETMWDHQNPSRVAVASNWRSLENWRKWENSEIRKISEQKFTDHLDTETEYEIFDLGFYPH